MEEFLDVSVARPHVRLRDSGEHELVWPKHEFFSVRMAQVTDLVLGLGIEPHLRWKACTVASRGAHDQHLGEVAALRDYHSELARRARIAAWRSRSLAWVQARPYLPG